MRSRPWMLRSTRPLALSLLLLSSCAFRATPSATVALPPRIVTAAEWGSKPQPIPDARRHELRRVTMHHAGVVWRPEDEPFDKIRRLQLWGQRDKGWPDLPYHFLIAPDGRIFEGRNLAYAGETNTAYDTSGHLLVQLWGNFEVQRPTAGQIDAAVRLVAWLCHRHGVDPATILGHRDLAETSCPGRYFYRELQNGSFVARVRARLALHRRNAEPSILRDA